MQIEGLEAHVGRRGRIRIKGGLPLTVDGSPAAAAAQLSAASAQDGEAKAAGKELGPAALLVDVHGLEMRVRNVYTGGVADTPSIPEHFVGRSCVCRHHDSVMTCNPPSPMQTSFGTTELWSMLHQSCLDCAQGIWMLV